MTDTIRAALEAAEREPTTAGKIATFLRALHKAQPGVIATEKVGASACQYTAYPDAVPLLAAAVEAAAKEAPNA
jgi:hypothetical protein